MKKYKKGFLCFLLCLTATFAVGTLSACGEDEPTPPNGNEQVGGSGNEGGNENEGGEVSQKYTVTFDSDGGSVVEPQEVEENGTALKPTDPTKEEYTFLGWYDGGTKWNFSNAVTKNISLKAKWTKTACVLTLNNSDSSAGTLLGAGTYNYGDAKTIEAVTNLGYTFVGWFKGEEKVTDSTRLTIRIKSDVSYTAKWIECPVSLEQNDMEAGAVYGLGKTVLGKQTTIEAVTNEGYTFLGWYNGGTRLTREEKYTFTMTEASATYTAKWTSYTLTTDTKNKNGGTYSTYADTKVTAGESVTLTATPNRWYEFLGWYEGDTLVTKDATYMFIMPEENVSYTTKWVDTWKDEQGYNYWTFYQLGDDVIPIGGWTGPNPDAKTVGYVSNTTDEGYTPTRITLENYQTMKECGINSSYGLWDEWDNWTEHPRNQEVLNALDYCEQVGMVYLVSDPYARTIVGGGEQSLEQYQKSYMEKPAYAGTILKDEPGYVDFANLAGATKEWKESEELSDTLAYVNNLPNYAHMGKLYYDCHHWGATPPSNSPFSNYRQWLEVYMPTIQPQVFCYDYYPFNNGNTNFLGGYYQNLSDVRAVTQAYNVPFWMFAQTGTFGGSNADECRALSYAEVGFSVHTQLAYGSKGVNYFNYYAPLSYRLKQTACCINRNNEKTKSYDYVQKINKQVSAVGKVLLKCKSVGIIQVNNSLDPIPENDKITSYGALTSATGWGDAIVGCFEYRDYGYAYYIASNSVSSDATITLNFNGTYNLTKVQDAKETQTSGNSITVNVPAGEGVLVVVPKN